MPSASQDPQQVRRMFDAIAPRYDFLNRLLSALRDRSWRRAAAGELPAEACATVLDLCGGTGDLTREVARRGRAETVICCDFSHAMLRRAAPKLGRAGLRSRCLLLEADALRLPLADGSIDAVTLAFGLRNFSDMTAGLREILRVLRPGGHLVVLEFSRPSTPLWSRAYRFYLRRLLPRIGDAVAGRRGPYGYLARTIGEFPEAAILAGLIRDAGFAACGWTTRSRGIVAIHTAIKARSEALGGRD